jgi:hypothetical protein
MSTWTGKKQMDEELRARLGMAPWRYDLFLQILCRSRLVGLAALTAAVGSDALYSSSELGRAQVAIIVPALLYNAQEAGLSVLQQQ